MSWGLTKTRHFEKSCTYTHPRPSGSETFHTINLMELTASERRRARTHTTHTADAHLIVHSVRHTHIIRHIHRKRYCEKEWVWVRGVGNWMQFCFSLNIWSVFSRTGFSLAPNSQGLVLLNIIRLRSLYWSFAHKVQLKLTSASNPTIWKSHIHIQVFGEVLWSATLGAQGTFVVGG